MKLDLYDDSTDSEQCEGDAWMPGSYSEGGVANVPVSLSVALEEAELLSPCTYFTE